MPVSAETKTKMFSLLKKIMEENCPPLLIDKNAKDGMVVIRNTPIPYGYKKEIIPGMHFASALIRKDNVSFYFFPIYGVPKLFGELASDSIKCLDGKTCFISRRKSSWLKKKSTRSSKMN